MGSARDISPPWGGDSRLGSRVLEWVKTTLETRSVVLGEETLTYDITVFDPIEVFGTNGALEGSGGELKHPHFFYGKGLAPPKMDAMAETIKAADCFIVVTPEYNHTIPPALSSMIGHFGGSCYAYKPSAIVTYSPGPFGGTRAAMALRPFLSELGCLPVSKLACFPSPTDLFEENGVPKDPEHRMLKQLPQMLTQLEWLTVACCNQRAATGNPT
jgi:NAD(P)H-dependent FMN reductase